MSAAKTDTGTNDNLPLERLRADPARLEALAASDRRCANLARVVLDHIQEQEQG